MVSAQSAKNILKSFVPPAFMALLRRIKRSSNFSGNYASRDLALAHSTGYDAELILTKVTSSLLQVKNGQARYERDSVLFDEIQHSFPLLAGLLRAAVEDGNRLNVLDFGGSLGSTYFQCREFLSVIPELKWCIVEQEKFVDRGRKNFQTDVLKFYFDIEQYRADYSPSVILLSSVLQYLDDPYRWLDILIGLDANYIVLDRTPFSAIDRDRLCIQSVPPQIYSASYPCWIFSENKIKAQLQKKYQLVLMFDGADGTAVVDELPFGFKGMIWRKLDNA